VSASDLQAQQWQSDMLAQLAGASSKPDAAHPSPRDFPTATAHDASGPAGEPGREQAESAYRPTSHITAMAQRPRALQRIVSHRPATSRVGRYVGLAKTLIGGGGAPTDQVDALARLQTPLPTGRRVVVTGAHGGAGASTVALLLADTVHLYRPDGVVLLDASGHTGGLLSRLPRAPTMSVAGADKHLSAGDIEAVVKPHQRPMRAVLTPASNAHVAARVAARLQRRVGISVVDVGTHQPARQHTDRSRNDVTDPTNPTDPTESARGALIEGADAVVVVCENTVRGMLCVHAAVQDYLANGFVDASIVVVIVERVPHSGVTVTQARQEIHQSHDVTVADVPRDRHLAGGAHLHTHLLAPWTRHAVMRLAADVIDSSAGAR